MSTNSLAEIDAEIKSTKAALQNVRGTDAEVYARIVGYYRPVRNWNKGKKTEYDKRKLYEIDNTETSKKASVSKTNTVVEKKEIAKNAITDENIQSSKNSTALRYEFFSRKTCPNCPPVQTYLEKITNDITHIDVDSDEGLAHAAELGVFAAPTVILFDGTNEIGRAHSTAELEKLSVKTA